MLDKTISQALEPNPEGRFQSAEEMRQALESALREPEEKRRRRRRLGFAVVSALIVALGGVGAFAATKPDVRARAYAAAKPMIDKLRGAPPAEVAAAAPAELAANDKAEAPAEPAGEAVKPAADAPASPETTAAAKDDNDQGADDSEEAAGDDEKAEGDKAAAADEQKADDKGGGDEKQVEQPKPDEGKSAKAQKTTEKKAEGSDDDMFSAQPVKTSSADKLEAELAQAAELMQSGKKVKAFNAYRKIGKKHRKDARALKTWSEVAAQMKSYGEALRVARQWAKVDKSVEARMHLASMERKAGKRDDAIKTLNSLLQERPGLEEARVMLKSMSPEPRLAQR